MSGQGSLTNFNLSPPPVVFPSMRSGEGDWRIVDCTPDLGPIEDSISAVGTMMVTIARKDGAPMSENDLQVGGANWPNTLDSTGLMPSLGFSAPAGSAGVTYVISLSVFPTTQGRRFIRDVFMTVLALMG
jgi:hypothetical protein